MPSCPPVFWTLVEVNPASPHTPHLLVGCLPHKAPSVKHLSLSRAKQRPVVEVFKSLLVLLLCNHGWDITTHGKTGLSIFCLEIIVTEERLQSYKRVLCIHSVFSVVSQLYIIQYKARNFLFMVKTQKPIVKQLGCLQHWSTDETAMKKREKETSFCRNLVCSSIMKSTEKFDGSVMLS